MAPSRTPRRRPSRAETRRKIIDAAGEVFARQGIAATSLNDIAAEAGLTKGAVYSNFTGRDDLVLTIMEEHLVDRMRSATTAFDELSDLGEATAEAGARLAAGVDTDATWHRLLLEYWGIAMRNPTVHEGLATRRAQLREAITAAITRAAAQHGVDLPLPPEQLAVVVLALSNGLAVERGVEAAAVPDTLFADVLKLLVTPRGTGGDPDVSDTAAPPDPSAAPGTPGT
ncbi:TetR family transcriptional regulator [Amycolatopsis rhabdoformis]|uniref:TetR family transcriptional regulator n=1 Tax=Amycolatopsis rhabdoformis TaxID=1448059 RepID=A0ABZ1IG34_9PSEU|nr:TetR family transcriptional regulator [Amycolatopsis rhabdoformis]WSE32897.1 TetR family transcriptional regulator [Amycolatopsis rhabdoformis]